MTLHKLRSLVGSAALTALLSTQVHASPLYMTYFDSAVTSSSQIPFGVAVANRSPSGFTTVNSWLHGPSGTESRDTSRGPIAVANGRIDVAGPFTRAYDLAGASLGSSICLGCDYLFPGPVYDGTTDGGYNYTVGIGPARVPGIWRTDRVWQNAVFFSLASLASAGEEFTGITYDRARQSLWLLGSGAAGFSSTTRFVEVGLDFSFRSEFSAFGPGYGSRAGALAMDYEDDSLWVVPFGMGSPGINTIYSYTVSGQYGQTLAFNPLPSTRNFFGAEFELPAAASVAEPTTASLVLLATLVVVGVRSRRPQIRAAKGPKAMR